MLLDTAREIATGRHAEIGRRYGKARAAKRQPVSMSALRLAEMRRLNHARYGHALPDDDAGRDDAHIMAHHLALAGPRQAAGRRIRAWAEIAAPWMTSPEIAEIVAKVTDQPIRWKADTLAKALNLTEAERRRLCIRTIGAIDVTKAERLQARKLRDRQAKRANRRAQGAKPRAEWEAENNTSRTKPWIALGISRATWYRQNR
jgi:hypothetical protein